MKTRCSIRSVAVLLALACLPFGRLLACERPALRGSFLQPDAAGPWSGKRWQREFGYMKTAGIDQMVIQWTADSKNKTTVYPSGLAGYTQSTPNDVVDRALRAADESGAQVYLGLTISDDWWAHYANDVPWLKNEAKVANDLADDLWKRYRRHKSLAGWYLAFEVDNVQWDRLAAFYQATGNHLHKLTPGKPVMIAPFFNPAAGETAAQWQAMWESILSRSPLDIFALQDGVGAGHTTAIQLPKWFRATSDAVRKANPKMQFWVDTETFTLDDFGTMNIGSIVEDMRRVQPYVSNYLSFSFNHYLSPQQANPLYYKTYLNYLATGRVERVSPTMPDALDAVAIDPMTISLIWTASTDNAGVVGYEVWRDGQLVTTLFNGESSFVDTLLQPNTAYTYQVSAFDAAGNESQLSDPATATTPPNDPYLTDLALGKAYTASLPADPSYPDAGGAELTDGIFGLIDYTDTAWQGRNTGAAYAFVIDLGAAEDIKELRSHWLQVEVASIFLPQQVSYFVSNDNVNFNLVGTVNKPAVGNSDQPVWYTLTNLASVSARYVRVDVTPPSEAWTFVDEIEVRQ